MQDFRTEMSTLLQISHPNIVNIIGKGLHSSTLQLNLSAFCGIGGARRGCPGEG